MSSVKGHGSRSSSASGSSNYYDSDGYLPDNGSSTEWSTRSSTAASSGSASGSSSNYSDLYSDSELDDYSPDEGSSPDSTARSSTTTNRIIGPEGYCSPSRQRMDAISDKIYPALSVPGYSILSEAFSRNQSTDYVGWAYESLDLLVSHFGKLSIEELGNGLNSSVFTMQQDGADQKQVLRLFSIENLRHPQLSTSYKLTNSRVGGEWLSASIDHPNVASNSHILTWDSKEGFRVLDQNAVKDLIANQDQLENGREIYAIGTVGDFTPGSFDLEEALKIRGRGFEGEELKGILKGLFEGVAAFNRENICHRDLKLSNVILLPSGAAKVIDFGSATRQSTNLRMSRGGDIYFHPQENVLTRKELPKSGKKADSYGLFRIVYHLVTGKDFFAGVERSFTAVKDEQRRHLANEKAIGFDQVLRRDSNLSGVDETLIDLMAALGRSNAYDRKFAEEALEMDYFKDRDVQVLSVA